MKLLILGGTVFLGRHLVDAARARGHEITLFNRGQHHPDLFPEVEKLRGDRNGDLVTLRGRAFDAAIDTSGYRPEQVRASLDALDGAPHYTFISSISVYRSFPPGRTFAEDADVAEGHEGYGPLKARAEDALRHRIPDRLASVRPGLIVGPHDPTGRFTYWPHRVADGGRVLAPGRPDRPVQFIDARDLAEWCVRIAEQQLTGTFNAVGPELLTMGRLVEECRRESGSGAEIVWIPDTDLLTAQVQPWTELPLWIPEDDPAFGGMLLADNRRAVAAGLTFRPVANTVRATLDWECARQPEPPSPIRVTPLTREREAQLLDRFAPQTMAP